MEKLKKHLRLGGSKKGGAGSQRGEYTAAQKSCSAQDLIPQSPTRFQPSVSTSSHHEFLDSHSVKSLASESSGARSHDHACCCKHHHGCCRHHGGGASQRSSTSTEFGCRAAVQSGTVEEESDVFDESASEANDVADHTTPNSEMVPAPPPVLDEYCDPVDLKKLNVNSDDHDLRGVYMPNHSLDDDYSVPYEVKKIMSDAKLLERFAENESDGSLRKAAASFYEPHEWLSSCDQQTATHSAANQQTPHMTPKRTVHPNPITGQQDSTKVLPSLGTDDPVLADGGRQPSNDLSADDVVASIVVDVEKDGILFSDDGNDVGGMVVSLSVELESVDTSASETDEAVTGNSPKAAAHRGQSKSSSTFHQNCKLKHAPHGSKGHQNKTDGVAVDSDASDVGLTSASASVKETIDAELALEQQWWYHGALGRLEAEELLSHQQEGSFLVRQSESNKLDFSLSLKSSGGVLHIKIVCHNGSYILGQFSQPFDSVPHMVRFFSRGKLPIRGNDEICLVHPVICSKQ